MEEHEPGSQIDRKFPWSFISFVSGVLFGIIGIYSVFFYSREPDFRVQVLSKAPVLSVSEDIPNLEILLDGQDIRKAKQGLSLVTARVANDGNFPVTTADFDTKDPLVLKISSGRIIRSDILDASDKYFERVFQDVVTTSSGLSFPPFIIDPKQYFVVKLLILHNEAVPPALTVQGKIAKIAAIPIADVAASHFEAGKRPTAFGGDLRIQTTRVLTYGFGTTLGLIGMIGVVLAVKALAESVAEQRRRRVRRERFRYFLNSLDANTSRRLRALGPLHERVGSKLPAALRLALRTDKDAHGQEQRYLDMRKLSRFLGIAAWEARDLLGKEPLLLDDGTLEALRRMEMDL